MEIVHTERNAKCEICSKNFCDRYTLKRHVETVHNKKKKLECEICHLKIERRDTYRRHMYQSHNIGEQKIWQCELCEKTFNIKSNLNRHTKTTHINKFECEICHLSLANIHTYRRHLYQTHNVGKHKFWLCDHCEKTYTVEKSLDYHTKFAHEKKLGCDICHLNFASRYLYKSHMSQIHNLGEQTIWQCDRCEKTFTDKSNLNRHGKSAHM